MASNSKKAAHAEKKRALLETKKVRTPENNPGLTRAAEPVAADRPKLSAVQDLPRVIEESKARLEAEGPAVLKRGRGRPPGSTKAATTAAAPAPEPEINNAPLEADVSLAPMISDGLQAFYAQRAASTGYEGFRIAPEKADLLANQAEAVAQMYFPQLSEKGSLVAVTLLTWGMHILGTELGYKRFSAAKRVEQIKQNSTPQPETPTVQPRASGLGVFPSSMAQ